MNWFMRLFARRRIYSELSEEIQQHLEEKTEILMAEGMSREQAESAAKREFGNTTRIEERGREAWMWPMIESLCADAKFAVRQLRRNYGFAISAIVTLSVGIGATAAIFSLVNTVLLRPLPFPEPDRLMAITEQDHSLPGVIPEPLSYPDYFDWRAQNQTFSGIASYLEGSATLESAGEAQHLNVVTVSANFFQVLGVAPMSGRDFRWDDEKPGNRAVMLSYSLWQSAFGSSQDITGRTIKLGERNYTVAGVMPKDFQFPLASRAPALWMSLANDAEDKDPVTSQRGLHMLDTVGRLKTEVTLEQARANLSLIAGDLARQYPDSSKALTSALVEPELQQLTGDAKPALHMLFGAVILVLLIACANVAGLLLARGSRRKAEFALRTAIGASRAAVIRQLLVESIVLSLCGGIAGIALAFPLLRGLTRFVPLDVPRIQNASIDGTALLLVVLVSVLTGILFGVLPACRMSQARPVQALRDGSRGVAGGRAQHRVHNGLVISQTAIGVVLLVSSGLLIRSFVRILNADLGFDPRHVLTARVGPSFDKLNHDQHFQFYNQLVTRLSALPGVKSASAGWPLPLSDSNFGTSFSIAGRPAAKGDEPHEQGGVVMPGYFETLGMPLLAGRRFEEKDGTAGVPVMMVNQAFARKYFPGENPVGKHIQVDLNDDVFDHPMREVVGVIGDIRRKALTANSEPQFYLPYSQALITNPYLTIRTTGDPAALQGSLRAAVHEIDKSVPVYQVLPLEDYVSKATAKPRFQALVLTCFAGIALLLAAVGLYGLLSYMVVQRTLEIGLRMALGARRADVLRLIVQRGLTLAVLGLAAGLIISGMITRLLSGMLYGISPYDPVTLAGMTGIMILVSLIASSIPAFRAARLDPMKTLREQ